MSEISKEIKNAPLYQGREQNEAKFEQVEIQLIEFSYKNSELVQLLQKRCSAIAKGNFKEVDKIEEQINQKKDMPDTSFKGKGKAPTFLEKWSEPSTAYLMFSDDHGQNLAMRHLSKQNENRPDFLGGKIDIKLADEPTNIIWENKELEAWEIEVKKFITILVCLVLLLISGTFIGWLKTQETSSKTNTPKSDVSK